MYCILSLDLLGRKRYMKAFIGSVYLTTSNNVSVNSTL